MARNRRSMFRRVLRAVLRCCCFLRKDNVQYGVEEYGKETDVTDATENNVALCINYTVNNFEQVNFRHFDYDKTCPRKLSRDGDGGDDNDDEDESLMSYHHKKESRALKGSTKKPGFDTVDHGGKKSRRHSPATEENIFPTVGEIIVGGAVGSEWSSDAIRSESFEDILNDVTEIGSRLDSEPCDRLSFKDASRAVGESLVLEYGQLSDVPQKGESQETDNLILTEELLIEFCSRDDSKNISSCDKSTSEKMADPVSYIPHYPTDTNEMASKKLSLYGTDDVPQYRPILELEHANKFPFLNDYTVPHGFENPYNDFLWSNSVSVYPSTMRVENKNPVKEEECSTKMEFYQSTYVSPSNMAVVDEELTLADNESLKVKLDCKESMKSLDIEEKIVEKLITKESVKAKNPSRRQRSEMPYRERNRQAAQKYRLKKKEEDKVLKDVTKILHTIENEVDDTKRKVDGLEEVLGLGVLFFVRKLIEGSENEEQAAEKIFSLTHSHLSNIQHNQSLDVEAETTLFRDRIMPVLNERYPDLNHRVMKLWDERIEVTVKSLKRRNINL